MDGQAPFMTTAVCRTIDITSTLPSIRMNVTYVEAAVRRLPLFLFVLLRSVVAAAAAAVIVD